MTGYNPLVETRGYKMDHAFGICIGVGKKIGNRAAVLSHQLDVNLSLTLKASQILAPGKAASGGCNPGWSGRPNPQPPPRNVEKATGRIGSCLPETGKRISVIQNPWLIFPGNPSISFAGVDNSWDSGFYCDCLISLWLKPQVTSWDMPPAFLFSGLKYISNIEPSLKSNIITHEKVLLTS